MPRTLKNPKTEKRVKKQVFFAFFQGSALDERVRKICKGFNASANFFSSVISAFSALL
jgi:hypothetical protein